MSDEINWSVSKKDHALILIAATRVTREKLLNGHDEKHHEMNLIATHLNGCKLDLPKLLSFPFFDFAHDIAGIDKHLSRETGKLQNLFRPRCAKPGRR